MTPIGGRHWVFALLIAAAAHAVLVFSLPAPSPSASSNAGSGGVRIALAPQQGKPLLQQKAADTAETKDAAQPASKPHPKPRAATDSDPSPKPKPQPESSPESEPEPKPTDGPPPEPEPGPKSKPEPPPEANSEPKPAPKAVPRQKPQPPAAAEPQQRSDPEPEPKRPTDPAPAEPTPMATRATPKNPAAGANRNHAPAQDARATQRRRSGSTGSVSDTPPSYRSELSAWLQRYKHYPRRARRLGREGTVTLHFVMDRSGRVLAWEIRKSSGYELLDEAVREMIRKASPLPALPEGVPMQRLSLSVPVSFRLR